MTTISKLLSLVGQRFRPPAQRIVPLLERGDPVVMMREQDNPHDPNAVAVYLHLGYLLALDARTVAEFMDLQGVTKVEGTMAFGPQGGAKVRLDYSDGKSE